MADGGHAAVHHVGGGHHVGTGGGMAHGGLGQQFQGGVVEHRAAGGQDAAVAVAHVFAQADVGDDVERGPAMLEAAHGFLYDTVLGIGAAGLFVLLGRDAEKDHGLQAVIHGLFHLLFQLGQRQLVLAGHGADLLTEGLVLGLHHKIGHDEVFGQQGRGLAHHAADLGGPAQTSAAMEGLGHGSTSMRQCRGCVWGGWRRPVPVPEGPREGPARGKACAPMPLGDRGRDLPV